MQIFWDIIRGRKVIIKIKEVFKWITRAIAFLLGIIAVAGFYFGFCQSDFSKIEMNNMEQLRDVYSGWLKGEYIRLKIIDINRSGKNYKFDYYVFLPYKHKGKGDIVPRCRLNIFNKKLASILFDDPKIPKGKVYIEKVDSLIDVLIIFPGKGKLRKESLYTEKNDEK